MFFLVVGENTLFLHVFMLGVGGTAGHALWPSAFWNVLSVCLGLGTLGSAWGGGWGAWAEGTQHHVVFWPP